MFARITTTLLAGLLIWTAPARTQAEPTKDAPEIRAALKSMTRWKAMAEKACMTTFDVWVDLAPYAAYKYNEEYTRKKLLSAGYLGTAGSNLFNELRGACRTFRGNKPTTCVPVLKRFTKLVFRGHPKLEAKNTDVDLIADGKTLTVVYPPSIQWQTELMAKTLYSKFSCDGSEAM